MYTSRVFTHMEEMPQWLPALLPAESNSDRPMREMVGAMVSGPMKRMKSPMRPEKPTRTWKREATMMEPCNWEAKSQISAHNFFNSLSHFWQDIHFLLWLGLSIVLITGLAKLVISQYLLLACGSATLRWRPEMRCWPGWRSASRPDMSTQAWTAWPWTGPAMWMCHLGE